ncbi:acyl-CoA thioesterase [Helicobacter sp. MIT 05-5293]|uniref:acyl-CoA thioesterase n=1 Tax=Helicobacter sp. MIT 05-5293 TaxID=1548149 RepID=UPI00051CCE05|nr:acyl-CoA thioesterase [Helicobacter sp. MIT 05-5293]TLD80536.1 acyl-CoA thioesterase [Helicobacter sp. MIT 05-5293]
MEDIFDPKSLTMSVLAAPSMANFSGVMHGGELMRLLDQVAYACATRYCGCGVVTIGVDDVVFKHPIPIGSLVIFLARINYVGSTSCEVGIKVISEDIKNRFVTHCNSCYFTMVAIDPTGKKVKIPPLEPTTEDEIRRFEAAKKRKEFKKELKKKNS